MTNLTKLMATSALAVCLTVGVAGAATLNVVDWDHQGAFNGAGDDYANGYGANNPLDANWGAEPDTELGNTPNVAQSPFNSNGNTGSQNYYSVNTSNTPATLTYNTLQTVFNILWGSVDDYNTITFTQGDNSTVSFVGTTIANAIGGLTSNGGNYEVTALVNFTDFAGGGFKSVAFSTTQNSFEFALAPVPLPAGGLLLLGAVGGLAALRRRAKA